MTIDILSNSVTRALSLLGIGIALGCAAASGAATRPDGQGSGRSPAAISRPPQGSTPLDLDGDGKPDAWMLPGSAGAPDVAAYDLDGDGAPDVSLSFAAGGRLVRTELLHDLDRIPATSSVFADGRLASKARAHDGAGEASAPERWRDGAPEGARDPAPGAAAPPANDGARR